MPLETATSSMTEQQFEAQVRAAVIKAFPLLPTDQLTHQTTFSFKFGHATVTVDGKARSKANARADILVFFQGKPLAVLELKRPGVRLTDDDHEQGLSYARVLHPRPPLVVVTDGERTRIIETHSGELWEPAAPSEAALAALFTRAVTVAQADLKRAVGLLMGSSPDVWVQAVRQATAMAIEERSGSWGDPLSPFVRGFLLPRRITWLTRRLLEDRHRLVLIDGGPLAGKSSVLRELAERTADHADLAVLYVDADPGVDLFETVASILAGALDWPVTRDEARHWLTGLSRADGPALVIAVDNMSSDRDDLRRDIEAVTSDRFGTGVRVVLAVDDAVANRLATLRNGRSASALSKRAARLSLGPLDNEEFRRAEAQLGLNRMSVIPGGRFSQELRTPWILRAMAAKAAASPHYENPALMAALSPLPGLDLIGHVRGHFDVGGAPFGRYRELARAVLEDGQDQARPFELKLELLGNFVVRRSTAQAHSDAEDLRSMLESGLVREARSESGENILVIRLPELMASEIARLLAEELPGLSRTDPAHAAQWLAGAASNLPLGDVIAAQALIDAAIRNRGLSLQLIAELRERPPVRQTLPAGTSTAAWMEGVGVFSMTLKDDGAVLLERDGREELATPAEDGIAELVTFADLYPWLILSHLAGHRFELVAPGVTPAPRLDPDLLLRVGACPTVLRRPGGDPDVTSVPVHDVAEDLSMVCHGAGIVEPITWSMLQFFGREAEGVADRLIDEALASAEPPLLARLDVALRQASRSADRKRAAWAARVRTERLGPVLRTGLGAFVHD